MIKRTLLSGFGLILSAAVAFGNCPLSLKGGDAASVGVYIAPINGHDGQSIVYQADKLMTPASVMKSVTIAAALSSKPGTYRWETRVLAVGKIDNGTLDGNIIIEGSGDPTLGSTHFAKEQPDFIRLVSEAAARHGITSVTGAVTTAAEWPDAGPVPSWELEDIPGVDGAGFYRVNWSDNVFNLMIPSLQATPAIPGLNVKWNKKAAGLTAWRNPGSNNVTVTGQLGPKQKRASLRLSMPYPAAALTEALSKALNARKGEPGLSAKTDTTVLLTYLSPELKDVCRSLMIRSDNQMAEATLRLLAPGRSRSNALAAERNALKGACALEYARLADGSGLSRHNAISPRQLGEILKAMSTNGDYIGAFARVGLDGTVRSLMKGVPGRENFILKSGSMTGVVCYCGYRLDPETKEPTHVIAIMVNNAPDSANTRAEISALLSKIN